MRELNVQVSCSITKQGTYTAMHSVQYRKAVDLLLFLRKLEKEDYSHIHLCGFNLVKHTASEEM